MRPIKFRAYDVDDKVMRSWEEIDFTKDIGDDYYLVGYKASAVSVKYDHEQMIMQYTGLKDKNGVEIYEGDVVNITQYFGGHPYGEIKHIIKRSKYNNDLVADSESGDWRTPEVSMSFRKSDDYEVIGNIYEDKLLEEEEE